ncbi:virus attachment protein p12 family protein [Clostridium acetireducens DSM 10703]|jgi:hypothetical protein|uniref:Virus attachment protein p12 family protein n=1 Tax=Clostridium acetireducens DSM 10703 TaxID=1121290 RepID=A0A1E8F140_9CLOT|nr:FeoB-associated Cys-rich membrane protein [Clostridium acetireducens]OFI07155.1 virus attachment protein p12 family protein [Clostridium acetireducens DSM 10703]
MYFRNIFEMIFGGILVLLALWFLYSGIKKKSTGCNCSNCSAMCPYHKKKQEEENKNIK